MSYISTPTKTPLVSLTLHDFVQNAVKNFGDKECIKSRHENKTITLKELVREADNFATGLSKIGVKLGDKIGIITKTSIDAFIVNVGCIRGGFVTVNLSPALQEREIIQCINKIGISCVVSVDTYKNYNIIDLLIKSICDNKIFENENGTIASKNCPTVKAIVTISNISYRGMYNYHYVKSEGENGSNEYIKKAQKQIDCFDLTNVLFTSGTTGNSKAVGLTHHQLMNNFLIAYYLIALNDKEYKYCFYFPLNHLFGYMFMLYVFHPKQTLILPSYYYKTEENLKAISEENCNFVLGTPTMLIDLINHQKTKNLPLTLEKCYSAGAFCKENLLKDLREILKIKKIGIAYGSSEGLILTWKWIEEINKNTVHSLGDFLEQIEAKIVDESNNIVPLGTTGNLCVKGYSIIKKYINRDDSVNNFDKEGWFITGDAIYFDNNKKPHLAGRIKDIINRGGEKISPVEVENILESHPSVLEISVLGTNHERLGEEVCACVITKPGHLLTLNDIKDFCKEKLAYFKIPSRLEIMKEFPKTPLGKLQKGKLLDQINNI